mmetsp:Transcript_63003/g.168885  ORF Transcript_63003/g.168885 Transcript_63003/m.168885 type:complete len:100 (+) Transcript_63003:114-413(+)
MCWVVPGHFLGSGPAGQHGCTKSAVFAYSVATGRFRGVAVDAAPNLRGTGMLVVGVDGQCLWVHQVLVWLCLQVIRAVETECEDVFLLHCTAPGLGSSI